MDQIPPPSSARTVLLVGASRGLGLAMTGELVGKGWTVIGTVRGTARTGLHELAAANPGRVEVETLDIRDMAQLGALEERLAVRLAGRRLDMLFVNAGTTNPDPTQTIGEVSTADFTELMITNALSPMRVIERLERLVAADGLIGAMSSGQGSVANNETGQREAYRGSKAALNMFLRSFAARQTAMGPLTNGRAMVAMAPGWVRTELGGPEGRLSIEESVPRLVEVLLAQRGRPGLRYLDYLGRTVPW